jgi:hypothetical protein
MMKAEVIKSKVKGIPGYTPVWQVQVKLKRALYSYRRAAFLVLQKNAPVLMVYQMGQVGSTSICLGLNQAGQKINFHVHRLSPHAVERENRNRRKTSRIPGLPPSQAKGEWLSRYVLRRGRRAKVITVVREPISQTASRFFRAFPALTGKELSDPAVTTDELVRLFLHKGSHTIPLTWFDNELRHALGIDVYQYPFPTDKGYMSISQGNVDLLILKSELDDSVKERAIAEFLRLDHFRMPKRTKAAREGPYAAKYRDFVDGRVLPREYVDLICESRYVKHFYSDAEIEEMRSKWADGASERTLPSELREELVCASLGQSG